MTRISVYVTALALAAATPSGRGLQQPQRITVLYDAFGPASELERDWGFAALVEYGGRRVLFDTGNHAGVFQRNVARLKVDLNELDAVVISHRHGDHTTGLAHVLSVNPDVPIWTPREPAIFRSELPADFFARHAPLPRHLQYFDGGEPPQRSIGTAWPTARFETVTGTREVLPGFHLVPTLSRKPGTLEMNELSLAIRTSRGLVVIVGCAHPGVEHILSETAKLDPRLHLVTGGFHLVRTPRAEVERVASVLRDDLKVSRVAPGHCTSELGFAVFLQHFKDRFEAAGVGVVIPLP